jgi:hypothetical protein
MTPDAPRFTTLDLAEIAFSPETLHGFRNVGDDPLLVVSVHESGTLDQTFTEREPA